jgi:hypothetical protein
MHTNNKEYEWDPETHGVYEFKLYDHNDTRKLKEYKMIDLYPHADAVMYKLQGYEIVQLKHFRTYEEIKNLRTTIVMSSFF